MKLKISLLCIALLTLSACGNNQTDIDDAKKDLGVVESVDNADTNVDSNKDIEEPEIKQEVFEINYLTDTKFLELDSLSESDLDDGEIEISGTTIGEVDKITVSFSNENSSFPDDEYTLNKFNPGDKTFLYRAFSRLESFDFGKNVYVFKAETKEGTSELELIINLVEDESEISTDDNQELENNQDEQDLETDKNNAESNSDIDVSVLPISEEYGNPVQAGESITYSDLKGLSIVKKNIQKLTCENINEYLKKNIEGFFWWNSCRDIVKDKGVSVFVTRFIEDDKYVYEKHYLAFDSSYYGTYELESGSYDEENDGTKLSFVESKNNQFKEKNEDYSVLAIVNKLFREILGS